MRYIREFKDIDWDDWDDEEVEPSKIINVIKNKRINDNIIIGDTLRLKYNKIKIDCVVVDYKTTHGDIGVEFKFHINSHDCNGNGKNGHCWYFRNSRHIYDEIIKIIRCRNRSVLLP